METFDAIRQFVDNPRYEAERRRSLQSLPFENIDAPIRTLVEGFSRLSCCFTLQCCYGHFVYVGQAEPGNLEPLPLQDIGTVTYRIAYFALCLQDSPEGRTLFSRLAEIPSIDPAYVQFGSPGWFWGLHLNSFALQVEPERFQFQDQAIIGHTEALHVQQVRNIFFTRLRELIQ